ncbi:hypothetical protein KR074_008792 [Drosophila pseudoananassae]|nr:hypothetical protein KR074_008792 [Drosophila pseudoananassae]
MHLSLPKVLCICFIVSIFRFQKLACNLLSLYHVRYDAGAKRFYQGRQYILYLIYAYNLFCVFCNWLYNCTFRINRYALLIYFGPWIYYVRHKDAMLTTLNKMVGVHVELQSLLGKLFCVEVKRAVLCCFLVVFEVLSLACWQLAKYDFAQRHFTIGYIFFWLLQPLLQMNSYIWLLSVYEAMHQVLTAPELTRRERWKILKSLLKIHRKLGTIQRDVASYFTMYLMSVMVIFWEFFARIMIFGTGFSEELNRLILVNLKLWQINYMALILLLVATLFFLMADFKSQRDKFVKGVWHSGLLSQRICAFRERKVCRRRCRQTLDVVDLMLRTGNGPKDLLCPNISFMELRINDDNLFVLEKPAFILYLALLSLMAILIPFAAILNGFQLSLEYSPQMEYFCYYAVNYTFSNYTPPLALMLSRALGE